MVGIPSMSNVQAGASQQSDDFTQMEPCRRTFIANKTPSLSLQGFCCVSCSHTTIKPRVQDRNVLLCTALLGHSVNSLQRHSAVELQPGAIHTSYQTLCTTALCCAIQLHPAWLCSAGFILTVYWCSFCYSPPQPDC